MARFTPILMILLALIPLYYTLDCRKFSFAPACRGIMLKRSGAHAVLEQTGPVTEEGLEKSRDAKLLIWLLKAIEEEGAARSGCVNVNWLNEKLVNAEFDDVLN